MESKYPIQKKIAEKWLITGTSANLKEDAAPDIHGFVISVRS